MLTGPLLPATERLEREIRETLVQLDVPPVEGPLTELQKLGGEMLAWKEAIGRKVNVLSSLRYEGVGAGELPEPFNARLGFDLAAAS